MHSRTLLAFFLTAPLEAQCPVWSDAFGPPGVDGQVYALAIYDAGAGPVLYVAGNFRQAGDTPAQGIARWDGAGWSALPLGFDHNTVNALCVFDDGSGPKLYAGGTFVYVGAAGGTTVPAPGVARFDGTGWTGVGAGFDGSVLTLAVHDDGVGPRLYAGGTFQNSGATPCARIARWDGAGWSAVGGGMNGVVRTLCEHDEGAGLELFAGGEFTQAGGLPASFIARWNGTAWSALGPGLDNVVRALASFDQGTGPRLFAGGNFLFSGAQSIHGFARWDGAQWSAPAGQAPNVQGLGVHDAGTGPRLYVGVSFGGTGLHVYGGGPLQAVPGISVPPVAFATFDDGQGPGLFLGGTFGPGSGCGVRGIAVFRGVVRGVGVGAEIDGFPNGLFAHDDGSGSGPVLVAYGTTLTSGSGVALGSVARFVDGSWQDVPGVPTQPGAYVAASFDAFPGGGRELVLGGGWQFNPRYALGLWNGSSWALRGAMATSGLVLDLAVFDDGSGPALFVAGSFSQIDGVPAVGIARWDGTTWSALGTGLTTATGAASSGRGLAVFDDGSGPKLWVTGPFDRAGGVPTPARTAVWDGTGWSGPGSSATGGGSSRLLVHDDGSGPALYGSAGITIAPGNVRCVVKWTGSNWGLVGGGVGPGSAYDLVAFDDGSGGGAQLYATGVLSSTGAFPTTGIARWNGQAWSEVAGGLSNAQSSLNAYADTFAVADLHGNGTPDLFVLGAFERAGGLYSMDIACLVACPPVSSFCGGDGLDAHVTTPCPCGNFGGPGRGCAWHNGPAGAVLSASGTPDPDTLVLVASDMSLNASSTIFLKGDALVVAGVVFGDGVRCIDGALIRLGIKNNVNGAAQFPEAGNLPVSVRGATPPGSGMIGYYQTYFRSAASFCTSATFNVTNAVRVVW